ncbi:FHA domain-containing protein [Myxococcaceae bacterium JPH2]|nr:FHA domain-containing protein [Myxococcaceae bacterium JPH2]
MSQLLLSALPVVCPNCDGLNPPRSAACALCSQALVSAPAARPVAPAGTPPRPAAPPPAPAGRPVAVATFPRAGEPTAPPTPPPPPSAVPPGMRPSARTPPPTAAAGLALEPRTPARTAPPVLGPAQAPAAPQPAPPGRTPTAPANTRPPPPVPDSALPNRPGTAPAAAPARPAPVASRFGLAVIAGSMRGQRYKLPVTGCVVGRQRGAILFADDVFVSPLHATFLVKEGALFVRDETSASGVYVTISSTEALVPRALFSAGQRLFRFTGRADAPAPISGRPAIYGAPVPLGQAVYGVEEVLMGGRAGRAVVTAAPLLTLGQAHCDLSYPNDEGMSGRHCELSPTPMGALLRDLSGGLGTYVRVPPMVERPLRPGDRVRLGQHVVQVETLG